MAIDVVAETLIECGRADVAAFAMDVAREPEWIGGVIEARQLGDGPPGKGTRVARTAKFLGRRIEYVNEIIEYEEGARLRMKSVAGPFPMEICYEFEDAEDGTLARIRVEGEASGFFRLASPLLAPMVRRSVHRDLRTLKGLLERSAVRS